MKQPLWRVGAMLNAATREKLLSYFPPRFEDVYCDGFTWAYKVTSEFDFIHGWHDACVYGIHSTPTTDALLVRFAGMALKPNGGYLHITLSTVPGVARASAGDIVQRRIIPVKPFTFPATLERFPLQVMPPRPIPIRQAAA
jgi:hypothetical protein